MPKVRVSAQRLSSMLGNRHQTVEFFRDSKLRLQADPNELVAHDCDLEFEDLVALAKKFSRPWPYLLIDEPEVFDNKGQDNRSHGNQQVPLSPELLDQIATIADMLDAAEEFFPDDTYEVPPKPITTDTQPEDAAVIIRDFLGVSWDEQLSTRDDYGVLRLWAEALQRRGVYVSQRALNDPVVRAFSRVQGEYAIVVVDTEPPLPRVFSLIHEYCHIVLRNTGLCDLDEHSTVERYCNAVTGAVLMPRGLLRQALSDKRVTGRVEDDEDLIRTMSLQLGVSQAALLIRMRERGLIADEYYDMLEYRRSQRRADEKKAPGGTYYPTRLNRVGRRYAGNVLAAYDDRLMDRQEASALLEIGQHSFWKYRDYFEGRSAS